MNYAKTVRAFRILLVSYGIPVLLLAGFLAILPTVVSGYWETPTRDPYSNTDGDGDEPYNVNPSPVKHFNIQNDVDARPAGKEDVRTESVDSAAQPTQLRRADISFSARLQLWLFTWMLR